MTQTYINLRFEQIERRFDEVERLLRLAYLNQDDIEMYQSLCRSAHVMLVSHFEGLYKDIAKDVIDDLNANCKFYEIKKAIFRTHCGYFIHQNESDKSSETLRNRLWDAFKEYKCELVSLPFLFVDNKNPTPQILETILEKFGIKNFFSSLDGSELDVVFEDQKTKMLKIRNKLLKYTKKSTQTFPYTVDVSIYNPVTKTNEKKRTLWEDFINNFLKERHNIIHG
ncbi:HEPN domain-containing protein, partial [Flavobacterium johnsoniae]